MYGVCFLVELSKHFLLHIISAPTLRAVIAELNKVVCKAHAIGIQLGVPFNKLKLFKTLPTDEIFPTIIDYWLEGNTDVEVTWNSIVAVLKSDPVDEIGLADRIQQKFCQPKGTLLWGAILVNRSLVHTLR